MARYRMYFEVQNKNGNVWSEDLCPAYTPREEAIESLKGCWYCRFSFERRTSPGDRDM